MEQLQTSSGSICDQLPSLSAKCPWFVAQNLEDGDDSGDQIFYTIQNPLSHYWCRIPELLGRRIRGYFHGWFILSNYPECVMWSLWNPVTTKTICLPQLVLEDGNFESVGECCLSYPPDDPSSILLLTRTDKPTFVFCRLHRKRKRIRWIEMSYAKQLTRLTLNGTLVRNLTCCNGKVYALNTDCNLAQIVMLVEIVVKHNEVVIKLVLFGSCPLKSCYCCPTSTCFLKGSGTELFCIIVGFHEESKEVPGDVYLFKLDTTSIKWEELESLRHWDMANKLLEDLEYDDLEDLGKTRVMWEEMQDLKDGVFFVDLDRDHLIFYNPAVAAGLGGYIYMRGEMEYVMYAYNVNYKTIVPSFMPYPVLPTSHVSMLEFRSEADRQAAKCALDSKRDEIVVKSVMDVEVEINESLLLNIPINVLEMIMEHCVGVEYMNFRATCKQCHIAAPLIRWRNKTTIGRLQTYSLSSPWLMVVEKNRGVISFKDPMSGDNYFMKNSEVSFSDDKIYCSRFGWLLFNSSDFECLVFFNPFTNDLRKLPELEYTMCSLCFSAPPTSPDCMVVVFTTVREWLAHIHYVSGEPTWRTIELGVDLNSFSFPTFDGGDIYALCNNGDIIFKILGAESFGWKLSKFKAPLRCNKSRAQCFLTKCNRQLLLVIVGKFGESIEVLRQKDYTEEWEKVESLGKHMIYLCDETCVCIEAKTPEMGNKIYFPRLHSENKKIVFYSLETCMFHTFNGKNIKENVGDLFKTVHNRNIHVWIEPSWS